jgi:hypothetical protein
MMLKDRNQARKKVARAAVGTAVAGLVSTTHHWYGAYVYDTPWRAVVSLWIPCFVLLVVVALYIYWTKPGSKAGSIAFWVFFLSAVVFQVGFTIFECVYSHVLKDVLYFAGAPQEMLLRLFPPPAYHLPDDFLFELSGLLQLVGLIAAWWAFQVFRDGYKQTEN